MFLRSIRLRGFKSFPDPVEVRLEPGVAVVVGPNGSGKSNVADAIVWASGSLWTLGCCGSSCRHVMKTAIMSGSHCWPAPLAMISSMRAGGSPGR